MPGLAPLSARQLAGWERIARDWPIARNWPAATPVPGETPVVHRCLACGKGILLWTDELGRPYRYTDDQVLALTVSHLRNHHPDLDPDKPL